MPHRPYLTYVPGKEVQRERIRYLRSTGELMKGGWQLRILRKGSLTKSRGRVATDVLVSLDACRRRTCGAHARPDPASSRARRWQVRLISSFPSHAFHSVQKKRERERVGAQRCTQAPTGP